MKRLEFSDGKSNKFWEIDVEGSTYTVRYGRMGTDGTTNTKVWDSPEQAQKEADKITQKKMKKGYAEVAAAGPGASPSEALEQAIIDNPDDTEAWAVFADWLQGQDDPRGALVAAHLGGDKTAAAKLIEANKKAFYGPLLSQVDSDACAFEWKNGYWSDVKVGVNWDTDEETDLTKMVGQVLRHDSSKFLGALRLGMDRNAMDGEGDWRDGIAAVAKHGIRPSIREIEVGAYERGDDIEVSWTEIGSVGKLWTILPNLEKMTVQGGGIDLGTIQAPHLKALHLYTGGLHAQPIQAITKATLPKLETLEIWFGDEEYGAECDASHGRAIAQANLPKLKWLGLMNSMFSDDLPVVIVDSPLLPQLEVLDLSMGTMTDDGGETLLAAAASFQHLKRLNLDENFLSADMVARLKAAFPMVNIGDQEEPDDEWVYVSVGE